jgi:alpha-galactosidase
MDCYDCRLQWSHGWKVILDMQMSLAPKDNWDGLARYAGPDHWNDPDMMEVGNEGLSLEESRAHFSLWCMIAAPLIAGNDVRIMTNEVRDILTNKEAIAIDQDPLGNQGFRLYVDSHQEIWAKKLSNGEFAVCIMNVTDNEREVRAEWDRMRQVIGWNKNYNVRDIWNDRDAGTTEKNFTGKLKSHDVYLFRLSPLGE